MASALPREVNFDGLVSPTHNYAGLSHGNLASTKNQGLIARPKEAALQGLAKMKLLGQRGIPQGYIPPQLRPSVSILRQLGFRGSDKEVLHSAFEDAPSLLANCSSASSMWTANAATVTPACDTLDGKTHFTPANLVSNFHRSIEVKETTSYLNNLFADNQYFVVHNALPATDYFSDEGAANHTRLINEDGTGLHLFVFGKAQESDYPTPTQFPARQSLEACQAIVRRHQIPDKQVVYLQQNPAAIDAGVFHNDVISVGHDNVFLYHELAFYRQDEAIEAIQSSYQGTLHLIEVPSSAVTIEAAISSYLFNSQIVSLNSHSKLLLCPIECQQSESVRSFIEDQIINSKANPISELVYQDLRQSMKNGGGPACLRLRIPLTRDEQASLSPRIFFDRDSEDFLTNWIEEFYPEELQLADLKCIDRYQTNQRAIETLWAWIMG